MTKPEMRCGAMRGAGAGREGGRARSEHFREAETAVFEKSVALQSGACMEDFFLVQKFLVQKLDTLA